MERCLALAVPCKYCYVFKSPLWCKKPLHPPPMRLEEANTDLPALFPATRGFPLQCVQPVFSVKSPPFQRVGGWGQRGGLHKGTM